MLQALNLDLSRDSSLIVNLTEDSRTIFVVYTRPPHNVTPRDVREPFRKYPVPDTLPRHFHFALVKLKSINLDSSIPPRVQSL